MLAEDERPGFLTFCTVKGAPYGLMFLPNTGANRDQVPVCNLNNYVMMVVLEKKNMSDGSWGEGGAYAGSLRVPQVTSRL